MPIWTRLDPATGVLWSTSNTPSTDPPPLLKPDWSAVKASARDRIDPEVGETAGDEVKAEFRVTRIAVGSFEATAAEYPDSRPIFAARAEAIVESVSPECAVTVAVRVVPPEVRASDQLCPVETLPERANRWETTWLIEPLPALTVSVARLPPLWEISSVSASDGETVAAYPATVPICEARPRATEARVSPESTV